jgi:hypothetical protein
LHHAPPGIIELFEVAGILVDLIILFCEYRTEGTELLIGNRLERTKVHNRVDVLGKEVCAGGDRIEASGDGFSSDFNECLHLVPRIGGSGTHLVGNRVIALNFKRGLSVWFGI